MKLKYFRTRSNYEKRRQLFVKAIHIAEYEFSTQLKTFKLEIRLSGSLLPEYFIIRTTSG